MTFGINPGEPEDYVRWAKPDPNKKYLYRYVDDRILYSGCTVLRIHCYAYEIIKRTPKGFWIKTSDSYWPRGEDDPIPRDCQKFVLDLSEYKAIRARRADLMSLDMPTTPPKRWAYESTGHAWKSFEIRKLRQQQYLEDQLKRVERVNKMIEEEKFEISYSNKLYYSDWCY